MNAAEELPESRSLVTVGGTTTDENGAYELTLRSDIDTYTISAQGGKNIITGEDNDSTFTVSSRVGFHINPASELASDLIEEGMSVEEAKDKVVEFVNSDLSNVDSISKEDLFDRSITKDMESQNRKGAMKAVVFNTLNNIKEMLKEAVEADAPSAESVEKEVRKAIAKEFKLINHKEGQNVDISNLVESAIDRVGEKIELFELKEVSKKSIISSTIKSQSLELTSIDLRDSNVFKTIAAVETKRHEIKEEKPIMEQLVKIDLSIESDDDSKLSVLKSIKDKRKVELEEERKTREPINFEFKLDKIKERLELQEQIFDLIEEAGSQIAYVRGITKYDEKEFLSILKIADSISYEFDELKSEIKERNDIENLGFDEGKFEKVQSAIDELYATLKKQQQLLSKPVEKPVEKPVGELDSINLDDLSSARTMVDNYFESAKIFTDLESFPSETSDVESFKGKIEKVVEDKVKEICDVWINEKLNSVEELVFLRRSLEQKMNSERQQEENENLSEIDRNLVEFKMSIMDKLYQIVRYYSPLLLNQSLPIIKETMDRFSYEASNASRYISNEINSIRTEMDNNQLRAYRWRNIVHYYFDISINEKLQPMLTDRLNSYTDLVSKNKGYGGIYDELSYGEMYYLIPKSEMKITKVDKEYGFVRIELSNPNKFKYDNSDGWNLILKEYFNEEIYVMDSKHLRNPIQIEENLNPELSKKTFDVAIGYRSESADNVRAHLPGMVIKGSFVTEGKGGNNPQKRVYLLGHECDSNAEDGSGYKLEPVELESNSCCFQPTWHNWVDGPENYSTFIGHTFRNSFVYLNDLASDMFSPWGRGTDATSFEEYLKTKREHNWDSIHYLGTTTWSTAIQLVGWRNVYIGDIPGAINNQVPLCGDYIPFIGRNGLFKTAEVTSPFVSKHSDHLYVKYDLEHKDAFLYELVEVEDENGDVEKVYRKYTGFAYRGRNASDFQLVNYPNALTDVMSVFVIGGVWQRGGQENAGLNTNNARGYKDCTGMERSDVFELQSGNMKGNPVVLHSGWLNKTVIWKDIEGEEITRYTFNTLVKNPFMNDVGPLLDNWSTYFVKISLSESGEIIIQFTTDKKQNGINTFMSPDENGKWTGMQTADCADTDGDGFPDVIDFDPNDPNVYFDYDMDGQHDLIDQFPWDSIHPTWTIVEDVETGEECAFNINLSNLESDYFTIVNYGERSSEGGKGEKGEPEFFEGPIKEVLELAQNNTTVYGYKFKEVSNLNPTLGITRKILTAKTAFDVRTWSTEEEVLERTLEMRDKYTGKGGEEFFA